MNAPRRWPGARYNVAMNTPLPVVRLKNAWRSSHPWIFQKLVEKPTVRPKPGSIVDVVGIDGEFIGRGFYNGHSRIAVRMPSAVADYLRSTYPNLNVQGVPMERQALQLLLSQQATYAVVDEAQLTRLSAEPEFAGLAVVGDIGLPQLLRVATRRDWPQLAGIVERGLHAIPARDMEQLHSHWLQPKYPKIGPSPGFWQNLCLLIGVLLLACMAIMFWQRRQQTARFVGDVRVAEAERLAHAIHVAHGDEGAAQPRRIQKVDGGVDGEAHFLPQGQDCRSGGDVR